MSDRTHDQIHLMQAVGLILVALAVIVTNLR